MRKNPIPWKENANSLLVVYSILAATCGIFIGVVFTDDIVRANWWIPILFLGASLWLFLFSAECLTDALDEDDLKKYLSILLLYNLAVICLITGISSIVYLRFISHPSYLLKELIFGCIMVLLNWRWLKHVCWLLRCTEGEFKRYQDELIGEQKAEEERCWTNIFLNIRKIIHKR